MKIMIRQLYILLISVFGICTITYAQNSNLVVFSDVNEPFTVLVNDWRVNQMPQRNIKTTGMRPGRYQLRIVFNNPSIPQLLANFELQPNRELTYGVIQTGGGLRELTFINEFTLGYHPIPTTQQFSYVYQGSNAMPADVSYPNPVPADVPVTNPVPVDVPVTNPVPVPVTTTTTVQETLVVVHGNPNVVPGPPAGPLPGYNGPVGCQQVMVQDDFRQAKQSIESKSFSSSKMTLAKQIARSNCLLTSQVRGIMDLFDYETDRLNFAKFAYDFTYDQGNYFKVNDAFDFESSIRSLEEFLEGRR